VKIYPVVLDKDFHDSCDAGLLMLLDRFQWTDVSSGSDMIEKFRALATAIISHISQFAVVAQSSSVSANFKLDTVDEEAETVNETEDSARKLSEVVADGASSSRSSTNGEAESEKSASKVTAVTVSSASREVFVSYAHADSDFVRQKLWTDLEKRNVSCWIDFMQLDAGAVWRRAIADAIKGCTTVRT
jgi:hypothetical protein